MSKNKIIEGEFLWIPLDKRKSRFGGAMSPRKPEIRKPLLWLINKNDEIYLVNDSGSNLDLVIASCGGFCTQVRITIHLDHLITLMMITK